MLPDRVSNPGPLTYESGAALPIALRGPAWIKMKEELRFFTHAVSGLYRHERTFRNITIY